MTFGFPAFFWASIALIPLAAVFFIRTRPRRQPVNTYFLWERIFQQKAASSLFQKLRNLLSLLLLALAFLAAVFALTRPRFDNGTSPDLLIIIDRSASMQSISDGKTHLETAKEVATSWITAMSGSQRAAIASVAGEIEYHANLTNRAKRLTSAIDAIEASDLALKPQALSELHLLTSAGETGDSDSKILFLTDLHFSDLEIPDGVEIHPIGKRKGNIGITAADLHRTSPGQATLFTTLSSTFSEDKEIELEVISADSDQTLARLFTVTVPANSETSESIAVNPIEPGAWMLRAIVEDSFAVDDIAPLGLNAPRAIKVQVKARNPYFFNQVISAFSRSGSLFEATEGFAELSLAQGNPPETPAAVIFAPAGESPFWVSPDGELAPGPPEIIAPDHPLLARVDPALLNFAGARKLTAPAGSVIVLSHEDGTPLLYTTSSGGRSAVVFNFDPALDDFFLSPWFPVFVHDAAVMLTGRSSTFPASVATGRTVEIPGTAPSGSATMLRNLATRKLEFTPEPMITQIANYTFTRNDSSWNLGGALFAPGESGPTPESISESSFQPASGWPLATWFLLAATVVILAEEFLYHRRKVG